MPFAIHNYASQNNLVLKIPAQFNFSLNFSWKQYAVNPVVNFEIIFMWQANLREVIVVPNQDSKIAAISQTTYSNAFSWTTMYDYRLIFHWNLFLRSELRISNIGSDNGLVPTSREAIIWTNDG